VDPDEYLQYPDLRQVQLLTQGVRTAKLAANGVGNEAPEGTNSAELMLRLTVANSENPLLYIFPDGYLSQ